MEAAGYYLGPLGALQWLPDAVGRLERASGRKETVRTSVNGAQRVFRAPRINRTWQVEIPDCEPWEYAALMDLDRHGSPPWWWIDPHAATHNLAPMSWGAGNGGGAMQTVDGHTFQASYTYASAAAAIQVQAGAPVVPGVPVTVSGWVRAFAGNTAKLWAGLYDAAGNSISTVGAATTVSNAAQGVRQSVTFLNPPANAVTVRVGHDRAAQVAGLAATWTKATTSYLPGMGCATAYLTDLSDDVQQVLEDKGATTRSHVRFRILELG